MKFLIFKIIRWAFVWLGKMFVNFVSSEHRKFKGVRLYSRIILIFIIPVLLFEGSFYYIREYIMFLIKEYAIFKYYEFFSQYNLITILRVSNVAIDVARTLLIIAFVVWYRTTSDVISRNVIDELQENFNQISDSKDIDKKIVLHWAQHISSCVYIYDESFNIIRISDHFKKWFKGHDISLTLLGMSVLRSPFCQSAAQRNRTVFAFDQKGMETAIEKIEFGSEKFTFSVSRKLMTNGESIIIVTLTEIDK